MTLPDHAAAVDRQRRHDLGRLYDALLHAENLAEIAAETGMSAELRAMRREAHERLVEVAEPVEWRP